MTVPPIAELEVTQEDRDAVIDHYIRKGMARHIAKGAVGKWADDNDLLQAFAKHRLSTLSTLSARVEELEAGLRNVLHWRVPHDDQLTVTDGSRRALREARSLLSEHLS